LRKAGEYAADKKIILTIEPINRYEVGLVNSIEDALKMAKAVNNPFVKIMGDTFHMQIEEGDGIPNAIRRARGHWIQHLHAADNTRETPGKGTMDWREIIRALHDVEYQGGISLEPLPKGASPYEARKGFIPKEKLDSDLKYGLLHLQKEQELVMRYV
jgi:sugar phosphate isomerase/epimerase